jgi:ankyrin repeat protein
MLIEAGADVNVQAKSGWSALMLASRYDHTVVVDILKQSGAN